MKREVVRFPRFGIKWLAIMWLFPGLVIAMTVSNQPWRIASFKAGQYISLINCIAASIIIFMICRRKIWPLILIFCIFSTRVFSEIVSDIFLNFLFCTVGAYICHKYPSVVYKELMFICLFNLIFMIMQITGVGQGTQFLVTDDSLTWSEPINTLFVEADDLGLMAALSRPAGLMHANNILSLIVLFGMALHIARTNDRVWWGTIVLCSIFIVGGAKVVLLGFVAICFYLFTNGSRKQRQNMLSAVFLSIIILFSYALLFPGLFELNTNIMKFENSIFVRINDIVAALPQDNVLVEISKPYLEGTPNRFDIQPGAHISGYSHIISKPFILAILVLILLIYYKHYRKLYSKYRIAAVNSFSVLIIIVIFPMATPFWNAQIYWFIAGFALLPLFMVFNKRLFQQSIKKSFELLSVRAESLQIGFPTGGRQD